MSTDAALDASLSVKAGATASPWDPLHSSGAPNGAHALTGPAGGLDDEFDLLSSRSKSPPTTVAASAGNGSLHLLATEFVQAVYVVNFLLILCKLPLDDNPVLYFAR